MSNKTTFRKIASVFFLAMVIPCCVFAQKKYNIVKKEKIEKAKIEEVKKQLEQTEIEKVNTLDFDIRFGKVVKVQDDVAFVQISSKLLERETTPIFFACDIRMRPVARLETMNTGFKDCFLFKITEGSPQQNDIVIARYYKIIDVVKPNENKESSQIKEQQKSENK